MTTKPELEPLAMDTGTWRAEIEVRPVPGATPQRSLGTMTARMCGPWLVTDFSVGAGAFEGRGIYGWDAVKQKYVGTWVDTMRDSLAVMEGKWDPVKRVMTFVGTMPRPDGQPRHWRETTEKADPNVRIFRTFIAVPEGEHEMLRVTYRRV